MKAFCCAVVLLGMFSALAHAEGVLDFADPCKSAENKFSSTSQALHAQADRVLAAWDSRTEPPGEVRPLYVEAIRTAAFQGWKKQPEVSTLIAELKKNNPTFDENGFFLTKVYPTVITQEKEAEMVRDLYRADYQANVRPKILAQREALNSQIAEQKAKLDDSCKPDVFNTFFRVTLGNAAMIVSRNFEASKNEKTLPGQAYRALTGISIDAIAQNGILGGENSELRKAANAVAGGENSEIRKALRAVDQTLNPNNWKIDTNPSHWVPKVDIPPVNLGTVGGHRVCLPWC